MSNIVELEAVGKPKLFGNSTNTKELYIVVIEDPTLKSKSRIYVSTRLDQNPATASIAGYEITNNSTIVAEIKDTITYNDAIELAKKNSEMIENLMIPWQKIIRIKTMKLVFLK